MRGKRSKQYRKLMHQYQLAFSFREPYQVLLDAEIIRTAQTCKMRLGHMLQATLHGEIKPMITQCCIRHLYDLPKSPDKDAWIEVAKQAERRRCGHHELEEPLSTLECVTSVLDPKGSGTNRNRYVVASQDEEVRRAMRGVVGVPLVYVNRSVMILEPMARKSVEVRDGDERAKIRAGLKSRRTPNGPITAEKRKREDEDDGSAEADAEQNIQKKRKVKGPKGPNPLSMKKTKKEQKEQKPRRDQGEDVRLAVRKAMKADLEAADKTESAISSMEGGALAPTDSHTKRKRKRKPKTADQDAVVEPNREIDSS